MTSVLAGYNPHLLIGLSTLLFANDPQTDAAVIARNDQVIASGATFTYYSPTWQELEPQSGTYHFDSMRTVLQRAKTYGLPVLFNLKIIDSNQRTMPADLVTLPFNNAQVQARLIALLNLIVPQIQGQVQMVILGNEVNMYFRTHQTELSPYVTLYQAAATRLKTLMPGVSVSSSLTLPIFYVFPSYLIPLRDAVDFIATTYYPLGEGYQVATPSVEKITGDFSFVKRNAVGKKILFQELGYPSSTLNGSSETKQAEFFANCLAILKADPIYIGVNCMTLADLSDHRVLQYAAFIGINNSAFISFVKTIGLFTDAGVAKAAWKTFRDHALSIKKASYVGCNGTEQPTAYPNPWINSFHQNFLVTIDQVPPNTITKVYSRQGVMVRQLPATRGPLPWDLTDQAGQPLPSGDYFVEYVNSANQKKTMKLVVVR